MDFTKLNVEFANMQNTITKYNCILTEIRNRIKNNSRDINKFETKIKNTKKIRNYSKYYYLIHPSIIFILLIIDIKIDNPFINIILILFITHITSMIIIQLKNKNKKLII